MRNPSSLLPAIFVLTSLHSHAAMAGEPAPATPGPTAPSAPPASATPEASPAPAPPAAAQVPVEDAAASYAAPGSAESTPGSGPVAGRGEARREGAASSSAAGSGPPSAAAHAGGTTGGAERGTEEESEPTVAPARDTVGGHLAVGAIVGLAVPFGSADSSVAQSDLMGPGLYLGGDITYGVSRTVMVGAYGEVAMPAGESCLCRASWSAQSVSAIAAGPLLRYHLVQGTRFDPWLSYGVGFRRVSAGNDSFTGIDWARLQLGGDWYPSSSLGLGPVLEMSLGTFVSSSGALESKAVNAQFVLGLRVVFDSPGK